MPNEETLTRVLVKKPRTTAELDREKQKFLDKQRATIADRLKWEIENPPKFPRII